MSLSMRIPHRFILLLGLITGLLLAGWSALQLPLAAAPSAATISFSPSLTQLPTDQSVPISITVQNVEKLYGLELDVLFDPSVLVVESIAPGDFLEAGFIVEDDIDMQAGTAVLAYTQLAGQPVNGSGVIAILTVRRSGCLGESPLRLENVILSDNDGVAIDHQLEAGTTNSGAPTANRSINGALFHDVDGDGAQGSADTQLAGWPIYAQRYSLQPVGQIYTALTTREGEYQLADLTCGRYQMWSQNGETRVLTQTVDLTASGDLQLPALPITGTLEYPPQRVFLPGVMR